MSTECQQSVNKFGSCILYNPRALLRYIPIINVLAAVMCKRDPNMVSAPVWKWASTEHQRFCVLHLVWSKGCATAVTHNRCNGSIYRQYRVCRYCYTRKSASTDRRKSVNRASTERQQRVNRASTERQQSINTTSTECQQSVNDFGSCILYNPRAVLQQLPIINVLVAVMGKRECDMVTAAVWKSTSERQQFCVLHLV